MQDLERTIVCMKWGTLYPAQYVNVLFNACKRYLTRPFRFVCFTDSDAGLQAGIESHPIANIGLKKSSYSHGAWPKITVFLPHAGILSGRCLFIDLDTVLLESIDPLFDVPGDLVCIDSRPWRYKSGPPRTMTSFFSFTAGKMNWIVERFVERPDHFIERYGIEQDFLHSEVNGIQYWPADWLVSFKYHVRQPLIVDRFRPPERPDPPAKVLVFHGKPRPIDLVKPLKGNWDIFPHYGSGAVDWMVQYWNENQ